MMYFLFWGVVAILPLWGISSYLFGNIDKWENALLDFRLEQRAQQFTPASDIVVVGFDANTENLIQLHPELGLSNRTFPRDRLATMIDYLKKEGARAILLDVDLTNSTAEDKILAASIRKAGNVYGNIDLLENQSLDKYMATQLALYSNRGTQYLQNAVIFNLYIRPYLHKKALFNHYIMEVPTFWYNSGFLGADAKHFPPRASIIRALGEINSTLDTQQQELFAGYPRYQPAHTTDPYKDMFLLNCVNKEYDTNYPTGSAFLQRLLREALWVKTVPQETFPDTSDRLMTYCHIPPINPPLISTFKGLGFSFPHREDQVVREAPVLIRGYGGRFFTSLGISPVLDLQGTQNISYAHNKLTFKNKGGKKNFHTNNGFSVLINWRHPRLLAENIAKDIKNTFSPNEQVRLKNEVEGVSPHRSNVMLGGGHYYRNISAIDLLLQAENRPMPSNSTLYRFPGKPKTGQFSFKNKFVVFGDMVADIQQTPLSPITYKPEIIATVLDMTLNDTSNVYTVSGATGTIITALICLLIFTLIIWVFRNMFIGVVAALFIISLYWGASIVLFNGLSSVLQDNIQALLPQVFKTGLYLPLIGPTIAFIFSLIGSSLCFYFIYDREKRQLANVFSNYVSPQLMQHIVKDPEKALENLKGTKKELTVLFTDLKGFTTRFENTDPELMVYQLNEYFDEMTNVILRHGGTYDKYMGDAIMAFFGSPFDLPNHAELACAAAMEMQTALRYLNAQWQQVGLQPLEHGIGIASGDMFVGNFGSKKIKNFTVLGSNVNLGARLESYTREAGVPVIISQRTKQLADIHIKTRDLGLIQVKGFNEPVHVYGLLHYSKASTPGSTPIDAWTKNK